MRPVSSMERGATYPESSVQSRLALSGVVDLLGVVASSCVRVVNASSRTSSEPDVIDPFAVISPAAGGEALEGGSTEDVASKGVVVVVVVVSC